MPGVVGDPPQVEAHRGGVDLARALAVDEIDAGLAPHPGGEVGAPLLVAVRVRTVERTGLPVGAEPVAVGVGRVGLVTELARGQQPRYAPAAVSASGSRAHRQRRACDDERDRHQSQDEDDDACDGGRPARACAPAWRGRRARPGQAARGARHLVSGQNQVQVRVPETPHDDHDLADDVGGRHRAPVSGCHRSPRGSRPSRSSARGRSSSSGCRNALCWQSMMALRGRRASVRGGNQGSLIGLPLISTVSPARRDRLAGQPDDPSSRDRRRWCTCRRESGGRR